MPLLLRSLRVRGFPQVVAAYSANEFGNWFGEVALAVMVFDATNSVLATAALFLSMEFVPALIGPALVAHLETYGSRRVIPAVYLAEAAVYAALALVAGDFALIAVLVLAAADGALGLASRSLIRAVVAKTLEPHGMLREGNALINVGYTAAAAAGPILAGILVAGGSPRVALALNALTFLVVAVLIWRARDLPEVKADEEPWRKRLQDGLGYVRREPLLMLLVLGNGLAWLFLSSITPVEIAYVKDSLGAGDLGYGLLLTIWGIGMLLGGVAFAAARKVSLPVLVLGSSMLMGIAIGGMAVAPTLAVACVAGGFAGIGNGVQWVGVLSLAQERTAPHLQARVVSLVQSATWVVPGAGFVLGGVIATAVSPRASLLVAGAGVCAVVAASGIIGSRMGLGRPRAIPASASD